jgi:hypothetical protein
MGPTFSLIEELHMNLFTDAQHLTFLRGIGLAAFVFLLVKGLLWLVAPFVFLCVV